jgi:transposase
MDLNFGWEIDITVSLLGIDIAKNTFQLHGADNSGKAVHKKRLARRELAAHVANLPACTIVMEACGGEPTTGREFFNAADIQ